jgi:tetratricopeptide (TPR) repeat protein
MMARISPLDATMEKAIAAQRSGRNEEAEGLYRAVLQQQGDHAVANHNLGVLTAQGGDPLRSLPLFEVALQAQPGEPLFWISYARGLLLAGLPDDALETLRQARQRGFTGEGFDALASQAIARQGAAGKVPRTAEMLDSLGSTLTAQGAFDEAIQAYRQAIDLRPDFAEAHFHLGSVLSENGQIAQGFEHFMRRAELVHGTAAAARSGAKRMEPAHKLKHDREQREYLGGAVADDVGGCFRIENGARLEQPAVNPANATPALFARWRNGSPQMVVIDNFLSAAALERLRRYCAGSTIWRRPYEAGYIGATPEDGFACPLLAQIAEEIQATYADILGSHCFRYLGAFKYDSALSTGTNTHADNSAVNVNFYIAPDDANLDAASGGMRVWDVGAPDEATMRRYNGDEDAAREFLVRSGAKATIVPHRANRAVIFKSALFHKTDDCLFREGYLNKRINVSLLFGNLGDPT